MMCTCFFFKSFFVKKRRSEKTGLQWQAMVPCLLVSMCARGDCSNFEWCARFWFDNGDDVVNRIAYVANQYCGEVMTRSFSVFESRLVSVGDLFPNPFGVLEPPSRLDLWIRLCSSRQELVVPGSPLNCVQTLLRAGFFSSLRVRRRFIECLRHRRNVVLNTPNQSAVENARRARYYSFFIDLAEESFFLDLHFVSPSAWMNGGPMDNVLLYSTMVCIGVRREDVERLNARYNLRMTYFFPSQ